MSADAGLLWVATHGGGLIGVDPERAAITWVVTVAKGLPSDLLYGCCGDGQGPLWLETRRAIPCGRGGAWSWGLCVASSIGLSDWLDGSHHEKWLADADLYAANRAGRNRTRSAMDAGALDPQEDQVGYPAP